MRHSKAETWFRICVRSKSSGSAQAIEVQDPFQIKTLKWSTPFHAKRRCEGTYYAGYEQSKALGDDLFHWDDPSKATLIVFFIIGLHCMVYARSFKSRSSEPYPASPYVQNRLIILAALRILRGALFAFDLVSQRSCGNKGSRNFPAMRYRYSCNVIFERFMNHMVANA